MKPEQQEIQRLRKEVVKLKAERDILNKTAAPALVPNKTRFLIPGLTEASRAVTGPMVPAALMIQRPIRARARGGLSSKYKNIS